MAKKRKPTQHPRVGDLGTPELARQLPTEEYLADGHTRARRVTRQTTLDMCLQRGFIDQHEFDAGEKLYQLAYVAGFGEGRMTMNYDPARVSGLVKDFDSQAKAQERFRKAMNTLPAQAQQVVFLVCVMGSGLTDMECETRLTRNSGKDVLRNALGVLAIHFGFISPRAQSFHESHQWR